MSEWQPPPELRLAAAWGALDWTIASLTRAGEHLRLSERPGLEPLALELLELSERLVGLQRLVGAVWQEIREKATDGA